MMIMGLEKLALQADHCDLPSRRQSLNLLQSNLQLGNASTASIPHDLVGSSKEILKSAPELTQSVVAMQQIEQEHPKSASQHQRKIKLEVRTST